MLKKYFKKNNKSDGGFTHQNFLKKISGGFTLVETLVAISIFSMSIITMMSILGSGLSDINYAKSKMTATYVAQEGIEYVRNQRDNFVLYGGASGWEDFTTKFKPGDIEGPADPNFKRLITMTTVTSDEVKIVSTVSWTLKSVPHSITLTEDLFNWVE